MSPPYVPDELLYFLILAVHITSAHIVHCACKKGQTKTYNEEKYRKSVMNSFHFYLVNYSSYPIKQLGLQRQVTSSHSNSVVEPLRRNTSSFTSIEFCHNFSILLHTLSHMTHHMLIYVPTC